MGNNVLVGSGAKVLGPFTVGDNARIAAGAVVLGEVPPNATAVGVPAQVIHMTDPLVEELAAMNRRVEELERELMDLRKAVCKTKEERTA